MKKRVLIVILVVLILAIILCLCVFNKKEECGDISSALSVISQSDEMSKTAKIGQKMIFSVSDFDNFFKDSKLTSIKIKSLPSANEGTLCLGDTLVCVGQTISRENLYLLNFKTDNKKENSSSFVFSRDNCDYETKCNLYFVKGDNSAPTFLNGESFNIMTYSGIEAFGKVNSYDYENDKVNYVLLENVKNGKLDFDYESGNFAYTSNKSFVGTDYFKVVSYDKYGNYSDDKTILIEVNKFDDTYTLSDMVGREAYSSAIYLLENNIMSSTHVGNMNCFYPQKTISKLDFTVMLVNAMGIKEVDEVDNTGFADDSEIPKTLKGYVKKARDLGIITGEFDTSNGKFVFNPNKEITLAEASVMINKVLGKDAPIIETFCLDKNEIPTWAKDSLMALCEADVIKINDGYVNANKVLTREYAAEILYQFMNNLK